MGRTERSVADPRAHHAVDTRSPRRRARGVRTLRRVQVLEVHARSGSTPALGTLFISRSCLTPMLLNAPVGTPPAVLIHDVGERPAADRTESPHRIADGEDCVGVDAGW